MPRVRQSRRPPRCIALPQPCGHVSLDHRRHRRGASGARAFTERVARRARREIIHWHARREREREIYIYISIRRRLPAREERRRIATKSASSPKKRPLCSLPVGTRAGRLARSLDRDLGVRAERRRRVAGRDRARRDVRSSLRFVSFREASFFFGVSRVVVARRTAAPRAPRRAARRARGRACRLRCCDDGRARLW